MKVVTTRMRPGYLRRNGIPYSGQATLTEYFDRTNESNGDSWLIVTSTVDDSGEPGAAVHDLHALQARSRRLEVGAAAVRGDARGQGPLGPRRSVRALLDRLDHTWSPA